MGPLLREGCWTELLVSIPPTQGQYVGVDVRGDVELIREALDDSSSFGLIFDRHFPAIFRFVSRRLGSDLAEDLASDTFVIAFQRLESFDQTYSSALPWLYGIATNLIRNHRRSESRRLELIAAVGDQEATNYNDVESDQVVEALGTSAILASALLHLNEEDREALLLFAWADLPQQHIARIQGVPAGTVRSRIHRARKVVREHLARSQQEGNEKQSPSRDHREEIL